MANRLAAESSPYLRQHAQNPVEWYPWGEEAFTRARGEQKPIFLSIGYSTCHWCHVMEHESFESPAIATFLRDHFISIKVDREERPDIDQVYMTFVQATTGHGGWPLSVWLTPELRPFYGGTYFAPRDHPGRPSFLFVLRRLAELWQKERPQIETQAASTLAALRETPARTETAVSVADPAGATAAAIVAALGQNARLFDSAQGGFGSAPKFPRAANLEFLLGLAAGRGGIAAEEAALPRGLALPTLRQMARGGLHDHLGGGFHRYSVDAAWHVPHFEKMLYDQAQLIPVYLRAFALARDPFFAAIARRTLAYVLTDLTSPDGAFFSAEDADSLARATSAHKTEGAFYVWSAAEIAEVLGPERAAEFNAVYGVEADGNVDPGADPQGELRGQNVLIQRRSLADAAADLHQTPEQLEAHLAESGARLLARRKLRPRPHLDDKILTAWNGLMIGAAARVFQLLAEAEALRAAQRAATFLYENLYDVASGHLHRSYRGSAAPIPGFAADYAALIGGLLDLYQADFDLRWLDWARRLQERLDLDFWDAAPGGGGYYSTTDRDPTILLRLKEDYDGAEPAPSSLAAGNLVRLAELGLGQAYRQTAEQTIAALAPRWREQPLALPTLLNAAARLETSPPLLLLHAPAPEDAALLALLAAARSAAGNPNLVIIRISTAAERKFFGKENGAVRHLPESASVATAYLCQNFTCQLPIQVPAELARALQET